jgi:hypothetical protein
MSPEFRSVCTRRARTSDNRVMGFVTIEDATGLAEVSFFPDQLPLYKTICSYGGPVWVSGRVTEHLASLSLDGAGCGRIMEQIPVLAAASS